MDSRTIVGIAPQDTSEPQGARSEDTSQDLDREHREIVRRVSRNDTRVGQHEDAEDQDGNLVKGIQELAAKREGLGERRAHRRLPTL